MMMTQQGSSVSENDPLLPLSSEQQQQQNNNNEKTTNHINGGKGVSSSIRSWVVGEEEEEGEAVQAGESPRGESCDKQEPPRPKTTSSLRSSQHSNRPFLFPQQISLFGRRYAFSDRFSSSLRDQALREEGVGAAAFLIRDAVCEVENPADGAYDPYSTLDDSWKSRNTIAIVCGRICALRGFLRLTVAAAWTMVLLTFIEPPHWCRKKNRSSEQDSEFSDHGCHTYLTMEGIPASTQTVDNNEGGDVQETTLLYPNSKSMLLTVQQSHFIDAICLSILLLYTLLRLGRDGMSLTRFLRPGSAQLNRCTQLVCILLMTVGLYTKFTIHHPYTRLHLLVTVLPKAQQELIIVLRMLPEIIRILALLFVFMLFYAWFGTVMFLGSQEGKLYFPNLIESLWTLYIMVTTANYPDVMMPAYNDNRWSALYFVSFMIISFFFLMNIVLASVVNTYDSSVEARQQARQSSAEESLRRAYRHLDPHKTGRIKRETVMGVFVILNTDFPEFRTLSDDDTKLLFAILDQDGSETITPDEFLNIGQVLLLEFVRMSDYASLVQMYFPNIYKTSRYQQFASWVRSNTCDTAIDIILILNAIVIGIQSYPELSGQNVELDPKYWDGSIDTKWEVMETVFTIIYAVEMVTKITVYGTKEFFEHVKNVFDLTITTLAVISSAIVYYPNQFSDSRLIRMIVMIRVLRLMRLLTAMKPFKLLCAVTVEIIPKVSNVFMLLFYLVYPFAALGSDLYGGKITRDPNNPLSYLLLEATDFVDHEYWANNFNDMFSGINTLFNLLVVNNWTECEVGFEAVTKAKWVRFFYLAFHILGVVIVNNVVVAFIINNFMQQLEVSREKVDEEVVGNGETVIRNRQAVFDASEVTGTKTSLTGGYIARYRKSVRGDISAKEQDRLRRLFTQTSDRSDKDG